MSEGRSDRYVGRFAPSPTGDLHLGSLTTALASYLHARQAGGQWLLRIDDIDPPREVEGAASSILATLSALDLHWDDEVLYESTRHEAYRDAARRLLAEGHAFRCSCSRRDIELAGGGGSAYPGTCRDGPAQPGPTAIRMRTGDTKVSFVDGLQGSIYRPLERTEGDYVVYRRDELPAYHLATVLDDAHQGVTDVVRGTDLLDCTAVHIHLQRALGLHSPRYWHLPVVVNSTGQKLSKQTGAPGITATSARLHAPRLLALLGLEVPAELVGARPGELWSWAVGQWSIEGLSGRRAIEAGWRL